MSTLTNNVQLIGHLGKNPEVKTFENGNKVVKLLLATSEYRKNEKGEKETTTIWHNLTAWGTPASIAERFLIKGKKIAINGKLSSRKYTDKAGVSRIYTEVIISDLQMIA